jgi:hypothetical protein
MKNAIRLFSIATALIIAAGSAATAQTASIKDEVRRDWIQMKDTMMKISDAMPEDKFSFKTTPPQRNYGEQILHVAGANVGFLQSLGGKATPPAINAKATAKAEILKALADSFDYGTALIDAQTNETMLQAVKARFLGESSRARVAYFLIGHAWDIYGQMAVYLRLNGIVPPASQRP